MIDSFTNKKHGSIKPIIKGQHLYHVFCLKPTCNYHALVQKELLFPAEYCEFSLDYERNKLVCFVIKYNIFGYFFGKLL